MLMIEEAESAAPENEELGPQPLAPTGSTQLTVPKRRVVYAPELGLEIAELIAEGYTLGDICLLPQMPSRQTVHKWVINQPEFGRAYAAARELSAHQLEEEAILTGRRIYHMPTTSQAVRAAEVLMNQLRWSAARRNPRVYSEKGTLQIVVPVQINTSLDMGEGFAAGGTQDHPNIYTLEATIVTDIEGEPQQIRGPEKSLEALTTGTPLVPMGVQRPKPEPKEKKVVAVPTRRVHRSKAEVRAEYFKKHGAQKGAAAGRAKLIASGDKDA